MPRLMATLLAALAVGLPGCSRTGETPPVLPAPPVDVAPTPADPKDTSAIDLPASWQLLFVRFPDVWIANGDGTGQRLLIEDAEAPAWSPDHEQIAFFRGGNVWVADADGGNQRQLTSRWTEGNDEGRRFADAMRISWDPQAPRMTFSHYEQSQVRPAGAEADAIIEGTAIFDVMLDSPTGELRCHFDLCEDNAYYAFGGNCCPAWSPTGDHLAFARNGDVWLAGPRAAGEERPAAGRPGMSTWTWAWSFYRLAAVADYDGATDHASRWGVGTTRLSWSPDGTMLACGLHRLGGSGWEEVRILELTEDAPRHDLGVAREWTLTEAGSDPCFSPDGRYIAFADTMGVLVLPVEGNITPRRLIEDAHQPAW